MKRFILMTAAFSIAAIVVQSGGTAFADARRFEWNGKWSMNHDGWRGQLKIFSNDHIHYIDSRGIFRHGKVVSVRDRNQRMSFYIDFAGKRQYFTVHIFSWDKKKMAGTTISKGRAYGVYAFKR